MRKEVVFGIRRRFQRLFQREGQIAHVLLTRSPLVYSRRSLTARLACVKHAASVRPEPGSNSPLKTSPATASEDVVAGSTSCSIPTNYLLTNKLSELSIDLLGGPKLTEGLDGVVTDYLVDFWHTVEFSRIRRSPRLGRLGRPLRGNSSNLHCPFPPVKPPSWASATVPRPLVRRAQERPGRSRGDGVAARSGHPIDSDLAPRRNGQRPEHYGVRGAGSNRDTVTPATPCNDTEKCS